MIKDSRKIIVIAGCTASGKSSLALELAKVIDSPIINADSMQIYKGIEIISASPSKEDKKRVKHKLYNFLEPTKVFSAGKWANLASMAIKRTWEKGKTPIITGGSGLYINALINGLSPIPNVNEKTKQQTRIVIEEKGLDYIYEKIKDFDYKTYQKLNPNDSQRIQRAYNVYQDSSKSLSFWQEQKLQKPIQTNPFVITLLPEKDELYPVCNKRFEKMIEKGAIEEVKNISKYNLDNSHTAYRALGIKEIDDYLNNKISLDEAKKESCKKTRRYAKRQTTWFKRQIKSDLIIKNRFKIDFFDEIYQELQSFLLT